MHRSLNQIIECQGKPESIRVDNGPEYIGSKLLAWAETPNITIQRIQPGSQQQAAYLPSIYPVKNEAIIQDKIIQKHS